MRLVTYASEWSDRAGVLVGSSVVDADTAARRARLASEGDGRWTSNRRILAADRDALARLAAAAVEIADDQAAARPGAVRPIADVVLRPPILDPEKFICLGLNYRDHAEEAGLAVPKSPMLFAKFRNSLVGPAEPIVLPSCGEVFDYEAELAVVIGAPCKDVEVADALEYVGGAMALNDVSARDLQTETSQWLAGKAIDTFAPCGPALVLLDELDDLQALDIATRVNGQVVQDASTSLMIFSVAETIAFVSRLMTLMPGDIIATGTPAGVGFKREPQVLLRPGDVVEVEIEAIGTLRNPVALGAPSDRGTLPVRADAA